MVFAGVLGFNDPLFPWDVSEEVADAGAAAVEPAGRHEPKGDTEDVCGQVQDVEAGVVGGSDGA